MMFRTTLIFVICFVASTISQGSVGDTCTVESNGSPGVCKLLIECEKVRNDVVKHQKIPQTCGFQETHPIVCCPKNEKRLTGAISKSKCKQYSFAIDSRTSSQTECGHKIVKRIVGGDVASKKEFPHMAILGFEKNGNIKWICGGILISEEYILTVGRCASGHSSVGELKYVKLGITNLNDIENKQEIKVARTILHPEYKTTEVYNDIGLVKLEEPVKINSYVRPACLYTESDLPQEAIATGWGVTSNGKSTDVLQKVNINIIDYDTCNNAYKSNIGKRFKGIVKESQICGGSNGKDTCQGDSGGPLQIHHTGDGIMCMYDVIGVTSFGSARCGSDIPGVYTKISHYIKWIEDTIWPESLS